MNSNTEIQYKKLIKNTGIFALGTFGSKVLQFLIVPLYTYVLSTVEYGKIDLFTTTISLLIPFVTLLIQESIIRFLTVGEISQDQAINCGMVIFGFSCLLSALLFVPYSIYSGRKLAIVFSVLLAINSYVAIFQNYLKATGKTIDFTISGILNTFSFLILNVLLLVVFKAGLMGYLISLVVSSLITAIYITLRGGIIRRKYNSLNLSKILKNMLCFSIPLIPNNLMWWIMNAGDKYIINYYLGEGANGLYAISIKIPTVLTTMFGIFMQAWQLSAIEESNNERLSEFYSEVYKLMMTMLLLGTSVIIVLTKPLFSLLISKSFYEAQLYSPLLCVSTVINCMATFWGVTYVVSKNTRKAFSTTLIGAITNVLFNLLLIKSFGLAGVALGTALGYIVVLFFRIKDTKSVIQIKSDNTRTIIGLVIILTVSLIYWIENSEITTVVAIVSSVMIALLYRKELFHIIKKFKRK